MPVPDEFKKLCLNFHQDCFVIHGTVERVIASALETIDEVQARRITLFLDDVLEHGGNKDELRNIWAHCPVEIRFLNGDGILHFFREIQAQIRSA